MTPADQFTGLVHHSRVVLVLIDGSCVGWWLWSATVRCRGSLVGLVQGVRSTRNRLGDHPEPVGDDRPRWSIKTW